MLGGTHERFGILSGELTPRYVVGQAVRPHIPGRWECLLPHIPWGDLSSREREVPLLALPARIPSWMVSHGKKASESANVFPPSKRGNPIAAVAAICPLFLRIMQRVPRQREVGPGVREIRSERLHGCPRILPVAAQRFVSRRLAAISQATLRSCIGRVRRAMHAGLRERRA